MRLRLQTLPPLPQLKVWFFPNDACHLPTSILGLKKLICCRIELLGKAGVGHGDIVIKLEGFELCDETSFKIALRDGNLISLEARAGFVCKEVKAEDKDAEVVKPATLKRKSVVTDVSDGGPKEKKSKKSGAGKGTKRAKLEQTTDGEEDGDESDNSSSESSSESSDSSDSSQ